MEEIKATYFLHIRRNSASKKGESTTSRYPKTPTTFTPPPQNQNFCIRPCSHFKKPTSLTFSVSQRAAGKSLVHGRLYQIPVVRPETLLPATTTQFPVGVGLLMCQLVKFSLSSLVHLKSVLLPAKSLKPIQIG